MNSHGVRYVVIGGIASVIHGVPRATFDLDILIESNRENAQRLLDALVALRFGTATMATAETLLANEITIFKDRLLIDVLTSAPGLRFETAWKNREVHTHRGQDFPVVTIRDLIRSKRATGRVRDLQDVEALLSRKSQE
ncbi:MAG: hypothetical protein DWQ29_13950 [Planctomycetota bacterium]|nr:MAG: hypothetical protein DWQ29_13950 [Planctomycetota bacterium]